MSIEWIRSIRERASSRTTVRVNDRHSSLAGKVGAIIKTGFLGKDTMYELSFPASDGRKAKKAVVSAQNCKVVSIGGVSWEDPVGPETAQALPGAFQVKRSDRSSDQV